MQIFINTYGTYLHVKEEMFEIRTREKSGDKVKTNHIAAQKVSSFIISKGSALSTDAIALALKHNIDIVVTEYDGHPMGRFWHSKLGSTTRIRKDQLVASLNHLAVDWTKVWVARKLENQIEYLKNLKKHRKKLADFLEEKVKNIASHLESIRNIQAADIHLVADSIRGWEGSAGRQYFEGLSKSVPKEYSFESRSFRPAKDEFNAMLNYAYGILYSRIEKALMIAGLDPYVGFLHRDDYNMKSLVFDFIEPYRIYAERCVFGLFAAKKVNKQIFDKITGGIKLNTEGKPLLVEHFMKYLEHDKIKYKGRNQTRFNAIQMDAHHFANELIKP